MFHRNAISEPTSSAVIDIQFMLTNMTHAALGQKSRQPCSKLSCLRPFQRQLRQPPLLLFATCISSTPVNYLLVTSTIIVTLLTRQSRHRDQFAHAHIGVTLTCWLAIAGRVVSHAQSVDFPCYSCVNLSPVMADPDMDEDIFADLYVPPLSLSGPTYHDINR